ncbi:MAG: PTS sugar transporter subunit IIA [Kiritimatiellae bacterium]|nr:PTS sugar transporter subunit IIA [Kiritimatiellia bacterium]
MNRILTLEQAARHIQFDARELLHLAQRGEIASRRRGDEYFFEHQVIDEWAQRHLMSQPAKFLRLRHRDAMRQARKSIEDDRVIESLLKPEWIDAAMPSRTRPGVIRDMVALGLRTELLYDDVVLQQAVEEREEVASTAIGEGAAFLHPRFHDPYLAAGSFITFGRTVRPIFFGAPDGLTTDLFFLICCVNDVEHIHVLARLCLLMHGTDLAEQLREAPDANAIYQLLTAAEKEFLSTL